MQFYSIIKNAVCFAFFLSSCTCLIDHIPTHTTTHTNTHTYMYIHTHVYTHTYIHTQSLLRDGTFRFFSLFYALPYSGSHNVIEKKELLKGQTLQKLVKSRN